MVYLTQLEQNLPEEERRQVIAEKLAKKAALQRKYDQEHRNDPVNGPAFKRKRKQQHRDCLSKAKAQGRVVSQTIRLPNPDRPVSDDQLTKVHDKIAGKIADSHADYMQKVCRRDERDDDKNRDERDVHGKVAGNIAESHADYMKKVCRRDDDKNQKESKEKQLKLAREQLGDAQQQIKELQYQLELYKQGLESVNEQKEYYKWRCGRQEDDEIVFGYILDDGLDDGDDGYDSYLQSPAAKRRRTEC